MPPTVALFGLSANPPTGRGGHADIVHFLVRTCLFNQIWILPVYHHIYSSKRNLAPYKDRIEMCKLCFESKSSSECTVEVKTIEQEAATHFNQTAGASYRVGTIDILDYLSRKFQGVQFHLILGSDTYLDLCNGKWKESDR